MKSEIIKIINKKSSQPRLLNGRFILLASLIILRLASYFRSVSEERCKDKSSENGSDVNTDPDSMEE